MADRIISFWFKETSPSLWFAKDPAFDAQIRARFLAQLEQAAAGELSAWRASAAGRLAEIIVLDQFSRNVYRDTPQAFAQDGMALVLAQEAVAAGALTQLAQDERNFLLMPFMHSESGAIHAGAEALFRAHASANTLDFELRHRAIIAQFGRYPHRNHILGRASSAAEALFLQQAGSGF